MNYSDSIENNNLINNNSVFLALSLDSVINNYILIFIISIIVFSSISFHPTITPLVILGTRNISLIFLNITPLISLVIRIILIF